MKLFAERPECAFREAVQKAASAQFYGSEKVDDNETSHSTLFRCGGEEARPASAPFHCGAKGAKQTPGEEA